MAEVYEIAMNHSTTDVVVPTTTETVVITSPKITLPFRNHRVLVRAWGQLTVGAGATALTPRIRRGAATTGALVGEANAEAVKGAAGSTEPVTITVIDEVSDVDVVQYSFTVQQTGATGDGTIVQSAIEVIVT